MSGQFARSVQSHMDLLKALWTLNLVAIKSWRVLKDKLASSVEPELLTTYPNNNQRQLAGSLPKTNQRFSENCSNL